MSVSHADLAVELAPALLSSSPFAVHYTCSSPPYSPLSQLTDRTGIDSPDAFAPLAKASDDDSEAAGDASLSDAIVEVLRSLVADGDAYWAAKSKHRRAPASLVAITNTIRATVYSLRSAGLLHAAAAVAATMYLRRLASRDVKLVSHFTIHRYMVAAAVLANKMCSDTYYPLELYVSAGHSTKDVIVASEMALLTHLDFDVMVPSIKGAASADDFDETWAILLEIASTTKLSCNARTHGMPQSGPT